MPSPSVHALRNLALVGPAASGKTSLTEALLFAAGAIASRGSVERGDTVSDFDPQEHALGHSVFPALAACEHEGVRLQLIDTPGLPALAARALCAVEAVETAVLCIPASGGVDAQARRLFAGAAGACRMVVVNKVDVPGVDYAALLASLRDAFGAGCLPLNLPSSDGSGVADCYFSPDYDAATAGTSVRAAHNALVDQVVELDEALMARYLEQGETLEPAQLHAAFEAALRAGHLVPVCFVSARSGAGVDALLDVFARLAPDPGEGKAPAFVQGEGADARQVQVLPEAAAHVLAHVFQVHNDPYRGKLALLRIHQGTVQSGGQLYSGDAKKPLRVSHLLRVQGKQQVEVAAGGPGEILALARVDELHRDAVLHDSHDEDGFHLMPPPFAQPVAGVALSAAKLGDEQKLADALAMLCEEDAGIRVERDAQGKQLVLRAQGEAHLKLLLSQLAARWSLKPQTAPPTVAYRETVSASAQARYRHKKQSGGAGQFGEVELKVEPLARGEGFQFVDQVKGGTIPGTFMPAVEKGVRQALADGVLAGFPVEDVRVCVLDGKHHAVDSNEVSFVTAARHATADALREAAPLLLEPIGEVTVRMADADFGPVSAELTQRRGRLQGSEAPAPGVTELRAWVPLAEMDGFEARLRGLLAGECDFCLAFSHYERVPDEVRRRVFPAAG